MYLQKIISKKLKKEKTLFVVGILKATDEKSRIPDPDPDPKVGGTDPGSKSVPNCRGSTTQTEIDALNREYIFFYNIVVVNGLKLHV
jgi:hypothetical protein